MLILTRKRGESLKIGDEVTVTVLGLKGNNVRLGVAAPKSVAVHREEVYERILAQSSVKPEGEARRTAKTRKSLTRLQVETPL